jgi:hypothetical protein
MDGELKARMREELLPWHAYGDDFLSWPPQYREGWLLPWASWTYYFGWLDPVVPPVRLDDLAGEKHDDRGKSVGVTA